MRRPIAIIVLLIQFCVQISPHVHAEDIDVPAVEHGSGAALEPEVHSGTGEMLRPPESGTGSVETASGSTVASTTGAVIVPSVEPSSPPTFPVRVVVNEIMWMGSNVSTADEWVEIAAFSSGSAVAPRSLSGWTLRTVKAGVETVIARLPAVELSSGATIVVANNPAAASRLAVEPALVTTGMSLPNTQLLLRLRDGSGSLVDEADDGAGAPFAGANPSGGPKASMERAHPWQPGNAPSSWKTATLALGFDDGPAIFGTPGTLGARPETGSQSSESSQVSDPPVSSSSSSSSIPVGVPVVPVQSPPIIRFTEVLADPVGVDADEWMEVGSFDPGPWDLSELALRTGTSRFALSGTLQPGEHRRYGKVQTGLSLPNPGGTIELLWRDRVIDAWAYPPSVEGVSVGRSFEGAVAPQCVPSPDTANTGAPLDPVIGVQSSSTSAGKASLNLEARVVAGSLAGAACSWAYPDGFTSASCNPPSHAMIGPVSGDVILTLRDYCGNTMIRTLRVDIAGKSSLDDERQGVVCTPSSFTGVIVSEVFPNPVGDEAAGEWIELANPTSGTKVLCGWSIDDGEDGDAYALDRWQLHPGDRLLLTREETGLALNNDADAVRLLAPFPFGGSGAIEIVRYARSPEGRSFARRDDGAWFWTDTPTPEAENAFPAVLWPERVTAIVEGAMPNPEGSDAEGGEWIELRNLTPYPLPVHGWSIETASDRLALDGFILVPGVTRLQNVPTLSNADGFVRLLDRDGIPVSTLAWEKTASGEPAAPATVAHVSDRTFMGSDDCVRWMVKDADGNDENLMIDGISHDDGFSCVESLSALMENKNIELQKYSKGEVWTASIDGNDVAMMMLRSGLVTVDEASMSPFLPAYRLFETEARENGRGLWANTERANLIDESRRIADIRRILSTEGLVIDVSTPSGIVERGAAVSFSTNVPATIEVALGSGGYRPYVQPIVLDADAEIAVRAVADVQTVTGSVVSANSIQSYSLLKKSYPSVLVSEVYPRPTKGGEEWIELWNPSSEAVSLLGWTIDDVADDGSRPFVIRSNVVIASGSWLRLAGLPVAWNNDGDVVRVVDPRGWESDRLSYGAVKSGHAAAATFSNGSRVAVCTTVEPTPGSENRCVDPPAKTSRTAKRPASVRLSRIAVRYRNVLAALLPSPMRTVFSHLLNGYSPRTSFIWPILGLSVIWVIACIMIVFIVRNTPRGLR